MPLASVKVNVGGGLATRGKLVGVEVSWRLGGVARTLRQSRMGVASSAEELEEAGRAIQRALALGGHDLPSAELSSTDKDTLVRQALACFRAAQTMRDAG